MGNILQNSLDVTYEDFHTLIPQISFKCVRRKKWASLMAADMV